MTRWQLRRRRRDEDGAVLVLALIMITTVALVVGFVLTQGAGSLKAAVALRSVAGSSYAAEGAAQVAINNLRTGQGFASNPFEAAFNNGLDGAGCFGKDAAGNPVSTLALDGFYPRTGTDTGPTSALVECQGVKGTGMQGSPVPISSSNKPGYAIVTLDGPLTSVANGDKYSLKVRGGVYANGDVVGPVTVDNGGLRATGTCAGAIASPKACGVSQRIADPGYASDLPAGTVPPLQTPPGGCTSDGVAVFEPGYYDDAAALTTATNLCSTAWFKPGTYYFDFHNDGCADVCPAGLFGSGGNVWKVDGKNLVAGTPKGATTPGSNPTIPGSCVSPITDTSAQGVQFVFGGSSRMLIAKTSRVEICGSYHADRPPIEVYGLKTGDTPTRTDGKDLRVDSVPTKGAFGTSATPTALAPGGTVASWNVAKGAAQSTTLVASGFSPARAVPSGAIVTAATLKVTHQDVPPPSRGKTSDSTGSATITLGSGPSATSTSSLDVPYASSSTTSSIAIAGSNLTALQKAVHDKGYSGASVSYTANAKPTDAAGTATLDAITLDLSWYLPVQRGQQGTCVATGTTCPLIGMDGGNNKSVLYLQGTTYAPSAYLDILLGNFSSEVAKFGVVARQLRFASTNGNPDWTGPVFEIPDNSPGYGYNNTVVDLTVHLCPNRASGCTVSDEVALRARVQLWDPSGSPVAGKREVDVLGWSEQR